MASLCAVLEQLIHRLGLTEFPCGPGTWRQTAGCTDLAETQSLLDLLDCPASPWHQDPDWSPQAASLRRLAVLSPKQLSKRTIYGHFTTLRIIDKDVSVINTELLKFSKLEELVLSANRITEVPAHLLPATLKVLELRNNLVSSLGSLTSQPPPLLHYLGLACNPLGSPEDISNLTGQHWPALVCLDLRSCDFEDQSVLLGALSSLPRLRSLLLEGNPFTLGRSYPGLTLDALPRVSCLDTEWVSPEEREGFRGLSQVTAGVRDRARASVHLGRLRGIPAPRMSSDDSAPDFPLVSCSYLISYDFLTHALPARQNSDSERKHGADHVTEENKPQTEVKRDAVEPCVSGAKVSSHSSSSLPWAECVDFSEAQTHTVYDLRGFRSFLSRGMCVRVEEEKVLSWPAASEDAAGPKPGPKETKGAKGKDPLNKPASTKDKAKDKKKRVLPELVQDAPVRTVLGSVHVPLHALLLRGHKVALLCDFGPLRSETPPGAAQAQDKDVGKKVKEEKDSKRGGGGSGKKTAAAKGKVKAVKEAGPVSSVSVQQEALSLELSVELERWQSAAEATQELTTGHEGAFPLLQN